LDIIYTLYLAKVAAVRDATIVNITYYAESLLHISIILVLACLKCQESKISKTYFASLVFTIINYCNWLGKRATKTTTKILAI